MDRGRVRGVRGVACVIVAGLVLLGAFAGFSRQGAPHAQANLNQISGVEGEAYDINGHGQVVGILYYPMATGAFLVNPIDVNLDGRLEWFWNRTGAVTNPVNDLMVHLGRLNATGSAEADGINSWQQITGTSYTPDGYHAFLINPIDTDSDGRPDTWFVDSPPTDGVNDLMIDLGSPDPAGQTWANSINYHSIIVGRVVHDPGVPGATRYEGAVWSSSRGWQELGTLGGSNSTAMMISDTEVVVGWADYVDGARHAFVIEPVWDSGNGSWSWYEDTSPADGINDLMVDLGVGMANGVNCAPTVVGSSGLQAVKWDKIGGVWTRTDLFAGYATAVNELGTIAGVRLGKPMILDSVLGMHDLDTFSGRPWQINGVGWVAGYFISGTGEYHPAVWAPHLQPWAQFTSTPISGLTVEFNASLSKAHDGTIVSYEWYFGDGTTGSGKVVQHTYASAGTYDVSMNVTNDDGLWQNLTLTTNVQPPNAPPVPDIVVTVDGLSIIADASGSTDDGTIISYTWDFGDGISNSNMVASHTYAAAGTYNVNLTLMDDDYALAFASYAVTVSSPNLPPVPAMTITIDGLHVVSNASASYDPDGSITLLAWYFGDGSGWVTSIPEITPWIGWAMGHTYAAGGTYQVTLVVYDNGGLQSWLNQTIAVAAPAPPVADFYANVTDMQVVFDATSLSYDADGVIVSYRWDFSDGSDNGTEAYVIHDYVTPGTYDVYLEVIDNDGLVAWTMKPVTVSMANVPPVAAFSAVPTYLTVVFDASSSYDSDGSIVSYGWDFGDYSAGTGRTVLHEYWTAANYTVTLTVTDDDGLTDTASLVVTATESPPPGYNESIIELEAMLLNATDPSGQPLDNQTLDNLMLMSDLAFQVGVRKTSGSDQAVEVRKTSGANLLVVFNGMVEMYTLVGKLSGFWGWNLTLQANFIISLQTDQVRIQGVPNYAWYCGCAPTAAGMLMAYWDARGFDGLVKGEPGLLMNPDVWNMIATKEHLDDYVPFDPSNPTRYDDSIGNLIPDNSTKDPTLRHEDNCLADFMHTSWYSEEVGYGITLLSKVCAGLMEYTAKAPSLTGTPGVSYKGTANEFTGEAFKWWELCNQIKTGFPMLAAIDVNGDGSTDHMVTVVGYCQIGSAKLYAFHSTWDSTVYWGTFDMMKKEVCFGVYSIFTYTIENVSQLPA